MSEKKCEILLIGAGAVGSLCAARLAENPALHLSFCAKGQRLERLNRDGVFLNDRRIAAEAVSPAEPFGADFVLIATKSWSYAEALEMAGPFLKPASIIVPLLNGIAAGDQARSRYPEHLVVSGFFLGHASVRCGNHVRHDGVGCFSLGGKQPGAVKKCEELFRTSGINCDVPADFRQALWRKYILNVGINQSTAHFRCDYGGIQRDPEKIAFTRQLMAEAAEVGTALGIDCSGMVESAMQIVFNMPSEVKTSMAQDVEAGRPTEAELFAGTLCRLAAGQEIAVPANEKIRKEFLNFPYAESPASDS